MLLLFSAQMLVTDINAAKASASGSASASASGGNSASASASGSASVNNGVPSSSAGASVSTDPPTPVETTNSQTNTPDSSTSTATANTVPSNSNSNSNSGGSGSTSTGGSSNTQNTNSNSNSDNNNAEEDDEDDEIDISNVFTGNDGSNSGSSSGSSSSSNSNNQNSGSSSQNANTDNNTPSTTTNSNNQNEGQTGSPNTASSSASGTSGSSSTSTSSSSSTVNGVTCSISASAFSGNGGQFVELMYSGVSTGAYANCKGSFSADYNMLTYSCFDSQGIMRTQTSQYFPSYLQSNCYNTTGSQIALGLTNFTQGSLGSFIGKLNLIRSVFPNTTNSQIVYTCCDLYEQGKGYVFTQCNNDLGPVILQGKIGNEVDQYYISQPANVNATIINNQAAQQNGLNLQHGIQNSTVDNSSTVVDSETDSNATSTDENSIDSQTASGSEATMNQTDDSSSPVINQDALDFYGNWSDFHNNQVCAIDESPSTLSVKFNQDTYKVPAQCEWKEGSTGSQFLDCQATSRNTVVKSDCFTMTKLNYYWDNMVGYLCSETQSTFYACEKDLACYQSQLLQSLKNSRLADLYAWMYFDRTSALQVREICNLMLPSYCEVYDVFMTGFNANFGDLCTLE